MQRGAWVNGAIAGVVVFVWGMVAHMALPLGEMGVETLGGESAAVAALARETGDGGFFIFPYDADPARYEELYRTQPHGVAVVEPAGAPFGFGRRLAVELLTNVVCGWLAAFLFVAGLPAFGTWRSGAVGGAVLAGFAAVALDLSYWNWYSFPGDFVLGQLLTEVVGWALAGAFLGWRLGRG